MISYREQLEITLEANQELSEALQFASCYIEYVEEKNPELHAEADGTPSIKDMVKKALKN